VKEEGIGGAQGVRIGESKPKLVKSAGVDAQDSSIMWFYVYMAIIDRIFASSLSN